MTNSCFQNLQYKGGYKGLVVCKKLHGCNGRQISRVSELPKANLVVLDYRLYNAVKSKSSLKLLKSLGIISTESWSEYQAVIYRLLLNPSITIINSVNGLMNEFHLSRFSVTVHVRCAGNLSEHKERTKMVVSYQFASIAEMVKEELNK